MNRAAFLYSHPGARIPLNVSEGSVTTFDPDEGTLVTFAGDSNPAVLKVAGKWTWNAQVTPQGLMAAQLDFARCRVVLWNLDTRKAGTVLQGDFRETFGCTRDATDFVFRSAFTPDGKFFLAADHLRVRRWDAHSGKFLNSLTGGWDGPTPSPDGKTLALLGHGRRLEWWTADLKRRLKATAPLPSTCLNFMGATPVWSPDSRRLAFSCEREVRIWNVQASGIQTYRRAQKVEAPDRPVFSPDSRFLVAGEGQHGVEVWQVGNGQRVASSGPLTGGQVTDAAVTKDNLVLATVSDGRLLRLDLNQPDQVLKPLKVYRSPEAAASLWPRLRVNPQGTWFAMTDGHGRVQVVPLPLPVDWTSEGSK